MKNDRNDINDRNIKNKAAYMRNSHNMLNESGNQMPGASGINIAHMDMKPLLLMVISFFFVLLILGLAGFVMLQNQVNDLKVDLIKMESTRTVPYVVHHEINKS